MIKPTPTVSPGVPGSLAHTRSHAHRLKVLGMAVLVLLVLASGVAHGCRRSKTRSDATVDRPVPEEAAGPRPARR